MQSFDTKSGNGGKPTRSCSTITVGRVEDISPGRCVTVELSDGNELALYNVDGEFHATNNFCPHKGAPLAEGTLCGHTIECDWHGWQFDVRTGQCLTTNEQVEVYRVVIEDGWIKIEV
jgi:nitrite reductase/ring-hydroxylating ferredoxin subunit